MSNVDKIPVMDNFLIKQNGYPLDFRVANILDDVQNSRYFPATLMHHITIRNMTDTELENSMEKYHAAYDDPVYNSSRAVRALLISLIALAENEWNRRVEFREGYISLEQYYPDVYDANEPKILR